MDLNALLGDQAESLLGHTCKGITADELTKPGPAFLEIPIDVLSAPIDVEKIRLPTFRDYRVNAAADADLVAEAAALIAAAERPMMMAGAAKMADGAEMSVSGGLVELSAEVYVRFAILP